MLIYHRPHIAIHFFSKVLSLRLTNFRYWLCVDVKILRYSAILLKSAWWLFPWSRFSSSYTTPIRLASGCDYITFSSYIHCRIHFSGVLKKWTVFVNGLCWVKGTVGQTFQHQGSSRTRTLPNNKWPSYISSDYRSQNQFKNSIRCLVSWFSHRVFCFVLFSFLTTNLCDIKILCRWAE